MRSAYFIGKLSQDPILRGTPQGTAVTTLTIEVWEKKGETWETHTFQITVYGHAAQRICKQARKGDKIMAHCRIEGRQTRDLQGRTKFNHEYVANTVCAAFSDDYVASDGQHEKQQPERAEA